MLYVCTTHCACIQTNTYICIVILVKSNELYTYIYIYIYILIIIINVILVEYCHPWNLYEVFTLTIWL